VLEPLAVLSFAGQGATLAGSMCCDLTALPLDSEGSVHIRRLPFGATYSVGMRMVTAARGMRVASTVALAVADGARLARWFRLRTACCMTQIVKAECKSSSWPTNRAARKRFASFIGRTHAVLEWSGVCCRGGDVLDSAFYWIAESRRLADWGGVSATPIIG
jgi:hypothetical protein